MPEAQPVSCTHAHTATNNNYTHTHTHTRKNSAAHMRIANTHIHTHTHTNTHTHTRARALSHSLSLFPFDQRTDCTTGRRRPPHTARTPALLLRHTRTPPESHLRISARAAHTHTINGAALQRARAHTHVAGHSLQHTWHRKHAAWNVCPSAVRPPRTTGSPHRPHGSAPPFLRAPGA